MNQPLKILLVDDNPDDRALVIRALRRDFPDVQCEQVIDAQGLAQALEKSAFDLVSTDYQLKWTDGLAVLKAVKARWPDCPVIMFTGTGSEEIAVEAMKNGLDDYVLKSPKHYIRLPSAVRGALERTKAIKDRKRAQLALQESEERSRTLSRRLLEVQEEERRRISRELHDQTGQSLTSLLLGLCVLEKASTLKTARAQVKDLRTITAHALDEVKRLATGLRPALLDDLGLEVALKRLAQESAKTYGVSVDLHVKGLTNHRLSPQVETGLYRITQEAFTNTARHATAKHVSVLLTCSKSSVKLIIEDDGRGFDVEKALRLPGSAKHLGLLGMHERVALLNGTLSVESTPGSGTTIYVQVPLEARPSRRRPGS